ncbi:MAG: TetR/AcrR family transcriptional regulator [Acidimicrobiales bacterium]|nr:TetR/AcrR family transcriptional regulator [Acidimicrobiales bacterium]
MPRGATQGDITAATDGALHGRGKRSQILAAATELIAAHGVEGMTMRQLAAASGLNIATLYHYFGSKSDLLGAIVDERHYDDGLRELALPVDTTLAPGPRLAAFIAQLAGQALGELRLWRLLIGESLRDDAVALAEARRLSGALEQAVDRWLSELFPELDDDPATPARAAVTTVVTGQLLAVFLEEMLLGDDDRATRIDGRAAATAALVFPGPATRTVPGADPGADPGPAPS